MKKRCFNLETQEWEESDLPELDALGYLQSIYRDQGQPEARRLKAAIEALPFEKPKLAAIATYNTGEDFAERLEQRRLAPTKVSSPPPGEGSKPSGPSPAEVSAERMGKSFATIRRRV